MSSYFEKNRKKFYMLRLKSVSGKIFKIYLPSDTLILSGNSMYLTKVL